MNQKLLEAMQQVDRLMKEANQLGEAADVAQRDHRRAETALVNARNEMGRLLNESGLVGGDFCLVDAKTAPSNVLQHVFDRNPAG